jgi:hypothetical protein
MKTPLATLLITGIATVLPAHAADPVGALAERPKTPVYESAAAYERAVRGSRASMEAADSLLRRADMARELGHHREARALIHESRVILHREGPLDVHLKKVTVCAPHAGTTVSVGKPVKTAHFKGYEVIVLEGPEKLCSGVVSWDVLSHQGH